MVSVPGSPYIYTSVAGTGAVTIIPASNGVKTYRDVVTLIITTPNAVSATLTISDGTATVAVLNYPNAAIAPSTPMIVNFCDVPLEQLNPNAAWTITASTNASVYNVTVQYIERG